MSTLSDLQQFAIPGLVELAAGHNNLPVVRIVGKHKGEIYLHGAHVTRWQPAGQSEVLWLSQKSMWEENKPIRGGVPICFPWFGPNKADAKLPAHGFARTLPWSLLSIAPQDDAVTVVLSLTSNTETKKLWPNDFVLKFRVTFGKTLTMSLELTNTGPAPLTAEEALHTYFSVADVHKVSVSGLTEIRYIDKTDNMSEKTQQGPITITSETDRVYLNTTTPTRLDDPSSNRKIEIAKEGSKNTVVWNPWIAKAKAMPDFGDEEWPHMICIETCNVAASSITLAPAQSHTMTALISVS